MQGRHVKAVPAAIRKKKNKKSANRHRDNFSWDLFHIFATFLFTQI